MLPSPSHPGSKILDYAQLPMRPTAAGEFRHLFDGPTATLTNLEGHITTLRAGEAPHEPHRHPDEEMIILQSGTVDVNINGTIQRASAGSVFFFASNDLHGLKNTDAGPATYFVFRFLSPLTPAK
jgi:uncharacterized cupin superfamily protein